MMNNNNEETKKTQKTKGTLHKILEILGVVLIVIATILGTLYFTGNLGNKKEDTGKQTVTKLGFEDIGVLTTQEAMATIVKEIPKKDISIWFISIPFTGSKAIFSYDVSVKAGVNFSDIKVTPDEANKKVEIVIPKPFVVTTKLDKESFKLYEDTSNPLTRITIDDINKSQQELEEQAESDAINKGLYTKASDNAAIILKSFLSNSYPESEWEYNIVQEKNDD